jgi:hypothetical protein
MDAWLPPYADEPGGTSLVVVRSGVINDALLSLGKEHRAKIWPMPSEDVVRSQEGVIKYKRNLLPVRVHHALSRNRPIPEFLNDCARPGNRLEKRQIRRNDRNGRIAKAVWGASWLSPRSRARLILALTTPPGGTGLRNFARKLLGRT